MITNEEIAEITKSPDKFKLLRLNPFEDSITINGDDIKFSPLVVNEHIVGSSDNRQMVLLDTETTGTDHKTNEIIELAFVVVTYNVRWNTIISIDDVYDGFNQPSKPISDEITQITGITNEMVAGKHITYDSFKDHLPKGKYLIVAHNAGFDRKFVDRAFPELADKPWADSLTEIDWGKKGCHKKNLETLMYKLGYFYNAHRAVNDCLALGAVIHYNEAVQELYNNALKNTVEIHIKIAYELRMFAKNIGMKFDGDKKTWYKSYTSAQQWEEDREYLNTHNVFYTMFSNQQKTAFSRFKEEREKVSND